MLLWISFFVKQNSKRKEKIVLTIQDIVCIMNQCEMGDYDANQYI